jgi:uncharacterized sulfatase
MTGKWHLGPAPEIVTHGFDDVYYKNANRPGWANFDLDGNDRTPGAEDSDLYHLDANSAATCAFIKRHHSEPFFFYCAYRAPHVPLDAPPKYLNRFPGEMPERRRQALAMISAIDDGVGRILSTLREYGIEEKTLVFLIGDNGAPLKIHKLDAPGGGPGWDGSLNDPLNGEKGMLAEGGIRVPFVVYWKNRIPAGLVYAHPVISLDVAATAVALAGLPVDQNRLSLRGGQETVGCVQRTATPFNWCVLRTLHLVEPKHSDSVPLPPFREGASVRETTVGTAATLDGVNLIPYLRGEAEGAPHETLYWRWIAQSAVREGKWKYLRGGRREYLFDLDKDRGEKRSVLSDHPEVAKRLRAKLTRWSGELEPPGLETKQMSETWELYFDYYLDSKPAAKPALQREQGWLTRGGTAKLGPGGLQVRPAGAGTRLFIVMARLGLPAQLTAVIRLRPEQAGSGGIAWREAGQKDFSPEQVVKFDCARPGQWQEHRVAIAADGRVIHVRLLLPAGGADIESVEFQDPGGKALKSWRFGDSRHSP